MNTKMSKIIGLSLLIFTTNYALAYPSKVGFDCKQEQHGLFAATREGKNNILQLYLDNKCPLNITDGRGFTLYDIASLKGQKETIDWLIKHDLAKEGQYSSALYKLLQTGLRFLNHDAGVVDGRMNAATADGIKSFQKAIHQSQTGRPSVAWLPIFDTQLTKKMQSKLNELGFKAGGIDGIIGSGTRSAMQAFRQERKMPRGEYPYIDDQLIYQLMMAENEANKKAIARRDAERQARQIAQEAAQRQEEARLRAEAQRRATEKRQQAEAAAAKAEAQRLAHQKAAEAEKQRQAELTAQRRAEDEAATRALEAQQQAEAQQRAAQEAAADRIARNQREADAAAARELAARQAAAQQLANQQAAAQREAAAKEAAAREAARQAEARRIAQQKAAEAERQRLEKIEQEREAARKREAEIAAERARQAAENARKAEELARKQAEEAAKAAEKARSESRAAFRAAEKGKPIFALNSSKNTIIKPQEEEQKVAVVNGQRTRTPGFQKVAGRLQLQGSGRKLTSCSINGTALDLGWCRQYFPAGNGKRCQAVVSNTGVVVSLTCK